MKRIVQLVLVSAVALALGYFWGRSKVSRPLDSPTVSPSPGVGEGESPPPNPGWDLSSLTDDERKVRCLEAIGAYSVPLLPAPVIDPSIPMPLKTNFEGEVYLKWKNIPKAKQYIILIEDPSGTVVKTYKTTTTFLYLKALPRADKGELRLFLRMATQNLNELVGVPGRKYDLVVKPPLDLSAPKIKEIKIED